MELLIIFLSMIITLCLCRRLSSFLGSVYIWRWSAIISIIHFQKAQPNTHTETERGREEKKQIWQKVKVIWFLLYCCFKFSGCLKTSTIKSLKEILLISERVLWSYRKRRLWKERLQDSYLVQSLELNRRYYSWPLNNTGLNCEGPLTHG